LIQSLAENHRADSTTGLALSHHLHI